MTVTTIIGVDCATQPDRTGIARGVLAGDRLSLDDAHVCTRGTSAAATIAAWARAADERVLVAFDSPLGWPRELSRSLVDHRAGMPIATEARQMFRRTTDEVVAAMRKMPLAVGADRIAWTARATLGLMAEIRRELGTGLHLVWTPEWQVLGAIEVYPAATLLSHIESRVSPYKGSEQRDQRESLVDVLAAHMDIGDTARATMSQNPDALDAGICVLAGADFARGLAHAPPPEVEELAQSEGWIWFARTSDEGADALASALARARGRERG